MITPKLFVLCLILIGVQTRQIYRYRPSYIEDHLNIFDKDQEDIYANGDVNDDDDDVLVHPATQLRRISRELHGAMSGNMNIDGSLNLNAKIPLAENDNYELSAIGTATGLKTFSGYDAATGGLALDSVNGHSLSATMSHIPSLGDQLTASSKVNLLNNDNHRLDGTAYITRNLPSTVELPNFNTYGAGLDYMYKDKIGASLNAAHTDLFKKTDVSALGRLNLFKDRTSSLDLSAGATKSFSPFMPKSSWEPRLEIGFTKYF